MANAYKNKVVLADGTILIDLTQDTVTSAADIIAGKVGHLADGSVVTGTGSGGGIDGDDLAYGQTGGAIVGSAIVGISVVGTESGGAVVGEAIVGTAVVGAENGALAGSARVGVALAG